MPAAAPWIVAGVLGVVALNQTDDAFKAAAQFAKWAAIAGGVWIVGKQLRAF